MGISIRAIEMGEPSTVVLVIGGFADSLVRFRGRLLETMRRQGHVVHVAAPGLVPESELWRRLVTSGFVPHDAPISRTGMNPMSDLWTLWRLTGLCRQVGPSHVLAYTVKPIVYGLWAARMARVPNRFALITGLGFAFSGGGGLRSLAGVVVRKLYKHALRGVKCVFFQNPDDRRVFEDGGLLSGDTTSSVVNGSGVDLEEYAPTLPPQKPRFLLIARLLGAKGVREYVEAAQTLAPRHPEAAWSLVGWIDENPDAIGHNELEEWVRSGAIDYVGRLADVRPAIAACSVYVLPSYAEGTPRTVLEAMAMGRSVITTDAPGCRETVADGENGFLVPPQSVGALVEAMERFIENPSLAVSMGTRSREIAEEKYDVHQVNAVMMENMGL